MNPLFLFSSFGCNSDLNSKAPAEYLLIEEQLEYSAEWLEAADIDGDGDDEIFLYNKGKLQIGATDARVFELEAEPKLAVHKKTAGGEELIVAFGSSRTYSSAPLQIWRFDDEGEQMLWSLEKGQLGDLQYTDEGLFVVFSTSDGLKSGWLKENSIDIVLEERLALRQLPIERSLIAVGRVYGDEPRSDGDLRLYNVKSKEFSPLPSFRGIRALALSDLNQDGEQELLVSDGWHFKYGTEAKARVVLFDGIDSAEPPRLLASFEGEYTVERITPHEKEPLILVRAPKHGYLLQLDSLGWKRHQLSQLGDRGNIVFYEEGGTISILSSGAKVRKIALKKESK